MNKPLLIFLIMLGLKLLTGTLYASEPKQVFEFKPDSIYGYDFGDTGISIKMEAKAQIIDSIRVRVYPWVNGRYQMSSDGFLGAATIRFTDAVYLYDLSLTDNIKLKKRRQEIRILGVDPCPSCRLFNNPKFDIRIRFFAKQDSGEIKVIKGK